jgi:polynucleotide 5'-kinase involved in rRNA processing
MIKEQLKKPLPNSKHLYNKKGLSYFQYLEPNLSNSEKNAAKVLMVLGETGSGKSTFLNSLINYLCEVEMCDPIRYQIIVENTSDQTKSITK